MKRRLAHVCGCGAVVFAGCGAPVQKAAEAVNIAPAVEVERVDAGGAVADVARSDAGRVADSYRKADEVRRHDGTLWASYVYVDSRMARVPLLEPSEAMVHEYLDTHRSDLGLSPKAQLRQRANAAIDDFSVGKMQTFEYVVDGEGAPCVDWHVDLDVSWIDGALLSRVETFCANDPELSREERAVARVFGGTPSKAFLLRPEQPEWRTMVVHGRRLRAGWPSVKALGRDGEALLRAVGGNPDAYERTMKPALSIEYRLRAGGKGPCAGHRMRIEATPYRYEVLSACDGQPLGARCGGDTQHAWGVCMGGLVCKIYEQELHYAYGTCVAR